ncbi:hypothetical protein PINS_up022648 [Pythium insidiosum]|nr:hypothetical protein PINS_up012384 [Pythium insidiosum]GLE10503.1 hypothetical protein PINS_up022648 [Pythium insidiosum]
MANIPPTYKAYVYTQYGAFGDVLKLDANVPQGTLLPNDVRVRIVRAAVNPIDAILVSPHGSSFLGGSAPTTEQPFGLGFDLAGVVVEKGADVTDDKLKVGDHVYAMTPFSSIGSFAEYHVIDAQYVARKPSSLNWDHAGSAAVVSLTSYQALVKHAKLQSGQRVLILGGSSATGIFAVQLAKALGAFVYTTTSSRNAAFVKSLGADVVIDYTSQRWRDAVGEAHSLDVIYDCGMEPGAWNTDDAQTALKRDTGCFLTLGWTPEPPIDARFGAKNLGYINVKPSGEDLNEITKLIESGQTKTFVDTVFDFEQVVEAIKRQKERRSVGKLVIKVANE